QPDTRAGGAGVIKSLPTPRWLAKHVKTARSRRGIVPFTPPREGGAYDSHHWTAGIAGRTRRCGRVAARRARRRGPFGVTCAGAVGVTSVARPRGHVASEMGL